MGPVLPSRSVLALSSLLLLAPIPAPAQQTNAAQTLAATRQTLAAARSAEKAAPTKGAAQSVDAALRAYRQASSARTAEIASELRSLPKDSGALERAQNLVREMRGLGVSPNFGSEPTYATESEPNNSPATATVLDTASSTLVIAQGALGVAGDVDYYKITVPAGSHLWAYVTNDTSPESGDSNLYLFGSDGTTLIEYDEDDGTGNNLDGSVESDETPSIAGASLAAGGTYYLRVGHYASAALDGYLLMVAVQTGPGAAELEPNDNPGNAMTLISSADSYTFPPAGRIGVANAHLEPAGGDVDYYRVYLQYGNVLYVSVDADPERDGSATDVVVEILDSSMNLLLTMDSSGTTSYGGTPVSEAGALGGYFDSMVYIRVSEYGQGGGGGKRPASPSAVSSTYRILAALGNDYPVCLGQTMSFFANLQYDYSSFGYPYYFSGQVYGKVVRNGVPSTCQTQKACPGLQEIEPTRAMYFPLRNATDQPQCMTVTVQLSNGSSCVDPNEQIFVVAYGEEFDPYLILRPCASYLGDLGSSPVDATPRSFSVTVPPRSWTWLGFYDLAPGGGQGGRTPTAPASCAQDVFFTISGLPTGCLSDMQIQKTGPAVGVVGPGPVSYDIAVSNLGPMAAPAWQFQDVVPTGYALTDISSSNDNVYCFVPGFGYPSFPVAAGTLLQCTLTGPIPVGSLTTVTFQFDTTAVAAGTCVTNTATLVPPDPFIEERPQGEGGPNPFEYTDPNPTNDSSSATTCFGLAGDVSLLKLDSGVVGGGPDPVSAGNDLTYTIRVFNYGPGNAYGVSVFDDLKAVQRLNAPNARITVPLRFKAIRKPAAGGWTCTTPYPGVIGAVTCQSAVLPPGVHDIGLVVTVPPYCAPPASLLMRNTAILTSQTDSDPLNNVATQDTTVLAKPCFGVGGGQ